MKKKDQKNEQRILRHALRIFAKKGYFRTTVDDIARASRLAKGTLYLYFKDKSSLYISVIQEHFKAGIAFLRELQKEPLSNTEILCRIADSWTHHMIHLKSSFFMFSMENLNLSRNITKVVRPIAIENLSTMIDIIAEIIEKGVRAGEFRKVDSRVAALHYLNTIRTGFYIDLFVPGVAIDKKAALEIFFNGLKKRR